MEDKCDGPTNCNWRDRSEYWEVSWKLKESSFYTNFSENLSANNGGKKNLKGVMILFTNPSARARYDTRSIFKRSLTGLNSEFSFS